MALDFTQVLTQAGLSDEQALLYQALLQNGPQTAMGLSRLTPIKRTYVYKLMTQLVERGLATMESKSYGAKFSPTSPDRLLDLVENQRIQVNQANQALEQVLPTLKNMFAANETRPVVTYFEGIEGVKKVYLDTIGGGEEILALLQPTKIDRSLEQWLTNYYLKLRKSSNTHARVLVSGTKKAITYIKRDVEYLRKTKVIPESLYPLGHEVNIYGSKVALLNNLEGARLMGVIIDNISISRTFRSWFELTWSKL